MTCIVVILGSFREILLLIPVITFNYLN